MPLQALRAHGAGPRAAARAGRLSRARERLARALRTTVQAAYQQYGEKRIFSATSLKASFNLTLTLVLLLSLLAA